MPQRPKPTLNQADLDLIDRRSQKTIKKLLDESLDHVVKTLMNYIDDKTKDMATKDDISHLPTKEEYFESQDRLIRKLQDMREAVEIIPARTSENTEQLEDHETRITILESAITT